MIKFWKAKKESDKEASLNGEAFLSGKTKIIVKYNRKKWDLLNLVNYLAKENKELEFCQCEPRGGCIFFVREVLGEKAIEKYYEEDY